MPRKQVNKDQITDLVISKGLTQDQAAQLTGVTQGRISQIIAEAKTNPDIIAFRNEKADVFEGLQARLVNLANDDLLKSMLNKRGMTDVGILEDKIRLIRGQDTGLSYGQVQALALTININQPMTNTSDIVDVN